MFRATDIIIEAFTARLREEYGLMFGAGRPGDADLIAEIAQAALGRIARSNALYHNLDHTVTVTMVASDIARGRMIRDGNVRREEWLHFVVSAMTFAIGFVRDVCPGDAPGRVVVDEAGRTMALPRGATDGWLWPYFPDRSKLYVRQRFAGHKAIDPEILAGNIEYCRFPPLRDRNPDTDTWPGLLRAAHFIGAVADPSFLAKLKPLYLELKESGVLDQLGFIDAADLRAGYTALFWNHIHDLTRDAADLLRFTDSGRQWLANMYAQLLSEERQTPALGMVRRRKAG